jgi:carboxypeptidase Q
MITRAPRAVALALALACAACGPSPLYVAQTPGWVSDTASFMPAVRTEAAASIADAYRDAARRIVDTARADRRAYDTLVELSDTIGHRLAGSPSLDQAITWAAARMKTDGLDVRTEPVMVPHWKRGVEEAAIVAPHARPLTILGLGGSVSTPRGGITAPVVVVRDWDELERRKADVKGKIVVYNAAMPPWTRERGSGYGIAVEYRWSGASRAAKHGAVAVLVRSATSRSLNTPHTGSLGYDKDVAKIPAGSLTIEDAELLARLAARGPVQVRLRLESQVLPDAPSANVIGELSGRELPDEIVVIGAHLDSWDVGQGAHDDGAGCVTMMEALALIKRLGLQPRRTIRVVLFTNEENGLRGGKAYAQEHAAELPHTVLALEADSGGFQPTGFGVDHKDPAIARRIQQRIAQIATLLRPLGTLKVELGGGGADISPMKPAGVPQVGLWVDNRTYFDYHHTAADTVDKVDPAHLADMVAATAVLAYVVADLPERIDAPTVTLAEAPNRAP